MTRNCSVTASCLNLNRRVSRCTARVIDVGGTYIDERLTLFATASPTDGGVRLAQSVPPGDGDRDRGPNCLIIQGTTTLPEMTRFPD